MACVFILAVNHGSEAVNMGFSQGLDPSTIKLKDLASSSLGANSGKNMFAAPVIALIDNSIDADSYIVGGGDVFSIHILELPSISG